MPTTMAALLVLAAGLLPGAMYVWGFERQVGRWGIGLSDRILRFVGGSTLLHACFAPLTYWIWSAQWPSIRDSRPIAWGMWLIPVVYLALPFGAGSLVGLGTRRRWSWTRYATGPDPAPRAWDYLFQRNVDGWIRVKLKSGSWLGGAFADANGRRSYAAGYPEPQDLYLAAAVDTDPDTGEFLLGLDGQAVLSPGGLLLRWDEIEYLEFIDVGTSEEAASGSED